MLFVVFNTQTVDISLVFTDVDAPLVLALLIAGRARRGDRRAPDAVLTCAAAPQEPLTERGITPSGRVTALGLARCYRWVISFVTGE